MFTFISGAIRKWLITAEITGNIILAIQLTLPYLFLITNKKYVIPKNFAILNLFFLYAILSIFNPLNLTLFHGVLGLILHLSFWFAVAFYIENRSHIDITMIIKVILILGLIEIALALIQYELPPTDFLNKYANAKYVGGDDNYALVGNAVRVTGTFSYLGGFMAFVIFWGFIIWTLLRLQYNFLFVVFLSVIGLMAALMCGSRNATAVYIVIIGLGFFYELSLKQIFTSIQHSFIPFMILILVFIVYGARLKLDDRINTVISNFNERVETNKAAGEQDKRIYSNLYDVINFRGNYPFFGVGLGSTYQGATAIFGTSEYVLEYGYYEDELARIILEGGFVLLIFRVLLFIWMFKKLRIPILAKIVLFIAFFYFTQMVFNIYNSIFIFLGLILVDNVSKEQQLTLQSLKDDEEVCEIEN